MQWLLDESRPPTVGDTTQLRELAVGAGVALRREKSALNLALRLNDVVIHDNRKWFGGADIRLDAIIVHAPPAAGDVATQPQFYQPTTFRFPGVHKEQRLAIDQPGLLLFYGQPRLFLDLSILVSRDRKDTADLGHLISERLNSTEWKSAAAGVLAVAVAAPQAAVITAAVAGAAVLGNITAEILRQATGDTIGLYRVSFLQNRDRYGIGRHPQAGSHQVQDLSFWYDVVVDRRASREARTPTPGVAVG